MLERLQAVSVGINTLVLLILVFKYLQDMRRQRLDMEQQRLAIEKLRYELEGMRAEVRAKQSELVTATEDDIRTYVVEPLAEEIRKASRQLQDAAHDSANALMALTSELSPGTQERREEIMRAHINVMNTIHDDLERLLAVLTPVQKLVIGLRGALGDVESPASAQRK